MNDLHTENREQRAERLVWPSYLHTTAWLLAPFQEKYNAESCHIAPCQSEVLAES